MAKTPKPVTNGIAITVKVLQGKGLTKIPKQLHSPKGRMISSVRLRSHQFIKGLDGVLSKMKVDFTRLRPIRNVKEFYAILLEAHKRLQAKNIEAITATAWLGEGFVVVVDKHPTIKDLKKWSSQKYVLRMNEHLASKNSRALTLNGHFEKVDVKKSFWKIAQIYDVRLVQPGQKKGTQFFDAGTLASNTDNQFLPMRMEVKTRGAGKELPHQQAKFEEQLEKSPQGTKMTYSIEGEPGRHEIDLKDMVLIRDKLHPKRPLDEDFFSRVGVIAGMKPIVRIAPDANGRPYIRVKLPFDTDFMRHVIEHIMSDPKLL